MIFSVFEKQREINAIINDLRRQGNLDEAKLKKIRIKDFFGLTLLLGPMFFLACVFFYVFIRAYFECMDFFTQSCSDEDSLFVIRLCLVLGLIFSFLYYKFTQIFLREKLFYISIMTYGKRVTGKFIEGAVCGPSPGTHYRYEYSFYDGDQKLIKGTMSLGKYPTKKNRKKGDEIIVAYDPENPEKNVCILDGALDHYDLKLNREK